VKCLQKQMPEVVMTAGTGDAIALSQCARGLQKEK
jgi:hypothetical protein